jgi:hypothetical protein
MYRSGQYKTRNIVKTRVGNVVDQDEPEIESIEADVEELIEIEIPENGEEAYGEYDEIDDWLIWGEPEDAESVQHDGLEEDEDQYEYEGYEFAFDHEGQGYGDAGQNGDQAQEETYEEQGEQQETQEVPVRRAHFVEKWNDEEFPDLDESAFFAPSWSGDPDSRSVRMSNARLQ